MQFFFFSSNLPYGYQWFRLKMLVLLLPFPYTPKYQAMWKKILANCNKLSFIQIATYGYTASYVNYLECKDTFGHYTVYDELKTEPEVVMSGVLDYLGIPTKYTKNALEALKFDSQQGRFGNTKGDDDSFGTTDDWIEVDRIFREVGVPISTDMTLEQLTLILD